MIDETIAKIRLDHEWRDRVAFDAQNAFAEYAGLTGDVPKDYHPVRVVQIDLARWERRSFPLQGGEDLVRAGGMAEELGELVDALEDASSWAAVLDAVGDVMVYATQLATSHRLDFFALWAAAETLLLRDQMVFSLPHAALAMARGVGQANHVTIKSHGKIRGFDNRDRQRLSMAASLVEVILGALRFTRLIPENLGDVYLVTARRVMKRDWLRDAQSGGE